LKLKVPEDSTQPPVVAERLSRASSLPDPRPNAGRSTVEATIPAASSNLEQPNPENLETLAATWIADSSSDESDRAGARGARVEATVPQTQPGASDLSAGSPGAATIPFGLDEPASDDRLGSPAQADSEADFLLAAANATAGERALPEGMPATLGGYKVSKELGRGGMGAVYLARQISLGRDVALKVMAKQWARDPTFLARFTREAYAAAQLVHHNIVQIYDFGSDKGVSYFSMEYVDGQTLAELVQTEGAISPEVAVSHILQACRGLKVAHDHGMIHRDIKPENLMLNRYGVVKLADLGLVKVAALGAHPSASADDGIQRAAVPESETHDVESAPNVTRVRVAMGSPSYMAPEQARDSANVGPGADIYSLGCTLYALVTGRPPFQGKTAREVMTKHAVETVVPPDVVVERVPRALSGIILKMVAKNPDERYQSIDEVIAALEGFLSSERGTLLSPRPDEAEQLEKCVQALDASPSTRLRNWAFLGFILVCGAGILLGLSAGQPRLAAVVLGLGLLTPLIYAIRGTVSRETPLYAKVRQYLLESGPSERIAVALVVILPALLLLIAQPFWFVVIISAAVLASLAFSLVERKLVQERREPIERIQNVLKSMRLRGLDEESLRGFIAERCGPRWDSVGDAIFGYEGRLIAVQRWGRAEWDRARPKLARWRDTALAWIEAQVHARWEDRAHRRLQQLEEQSLKAQGMGFFEARRRARDVADVLISQARDLHEVSLKASRAVMQSLASDESRQRMFQKLRAAAEQPEQLLGTMERGLLARRSAESLNSLLGPRVRFIAGVGLLLGYLLWWFQNSADTPDIPTRPLWVPLLPSLLTGVVRDANAGVAALVLIASSLVPGWRISLVVFPTVAVALLATTLGIPAWLSLAAALALLALGLFLGRAAAPSPQASDAGTFGTKES
jgi:serine/threonine protein kinase